MVISLVLTLLGGIGYAVLPVEQFPNITPPVVNVTANYTGANAETVENTVAAPIEAQVNGVDDMIYMRSVSSGDGSLRITVTFAVGTDPDQNTINVNNRVQAAESALPEEVRRLGVTVRKQSSNMLEVINLESNDGRHDPIFISNYALVNIIDEIKRLPGVGDATIFGARDYSMRVWLRPDKLSQLGLTPDDIATAIREQNAQFAAGAIGRDPLDSPVETSYVVTTQGRMTDPEQFGKIILRANDDGTYLRLKDVARLELGATGYNLVSKHNKTPSVAIGIYLSPGANALATAERVDKAMHRLETTFPEDIVWSVPYDVTQFVRISVEEVRETLIAAFLLEF